MSESNHSVEWLSENGDIMIPVVDHETTTMIKVGHVDSGLDTTPRVLWTSTTETSPSPPSTLRALTFSRLTIVVSVVSKELYSSASSETAFATPAGVVVSGAGVDVVVKSCTILVSMSSSFSWSSSGMSLCPDMAKDISIWVALAVVVSWFIISRA